MFVDKDIVWSGRVSGCVDVGVGVGAGAEDSLRWFSRGASVGGAKVKLCIWAVWGSNGRPVVSGMPAAVVVVESL